MIIPDYTLRKIQQSVPVLCVDILLSYNKQFLLIKRKEEPLKDQFWVIGGRVHKNENVIDAARRKVMEETNLEPYYMKMIGIYDDQYEEGSSLGKFDSPYHTVAIVFEARVNSLDDLKLNDTSTEWMLSDTKPERFHISKFG